MFEQCLGMMYEEVVELLLAMGGCMDINTEECAVGFPSIYYADSPFGFYADTYEFFFDSEGRCVEIEFDEFEED